MKIDDEVRRCVAFVAIQKADESFVLKGTVFFIGREAADGIGLAYAVTARHVIEKIRDQGLEEVFLRVNLKDGTLGYARTHISEWLFPHDETVDLALRLVGLPKEYNHMMLHTGAFATEDWLSANEVSLGDELFITGLFRHHHGDVTNTPIVRVGNIAALPTELIQTAHCKREAFLIECRSIGGLSGSPVFTNLGLHRMLNGVVLQVAGRMTHRLLGVIHGHYDTEYSAVDAPEADAISEGRVNSGIAIVTPVSKLIAFLEEDHVVRADNERLSIIGAVDDH